MREECGTVKPILFVRHARRYWAVHRIDYKFMSVLARLPGEVTAHGYSHYLNNEVLTEQREGFTPPTFYMWHHTRGWVEFVEEYRPVGHNCDYYEVKHADDSRGVGFRAEDFLNTKDDSWI